MVIFNAMEMLSHSYKKLTSLITSDCPNFAVCKAAAFAILLAGSLKFLLGYPPPRLISLSSMLEKSANKLF